MYPSHSLVEVLMARMLTRSKERDNTWLQLPVCPSLLSNPNSDSKSAEPKICEDPEACLYAHPDQNLLRHVLNSGHIVCCHDFIFRARQGGCQRPSCKYFHPPDKLKMLVINAGRNNLRLRHQLDQQQQRLFNQQNQQWIQQQVLQQQQIPSLVTTSGTSFFLPPCNAGGAAMNVLAPPASLQPIASRKRASTEQEQEQMSKRSIDNDILTSSTMPTWSPSMMANSIVMPQLNLIGQPTPSFFWPQLGLQQQQQVVQPGTNFFPGTAQLQPFHF